MTNSPTPPEMKAEQPDDDMREATRNGMLAASAMLGQTPGDIRLACGEITPDEMRTVLAVLEWRRRAILERAVAMDRPCETCKGDPQFCADVAV